MAILQGCKIWLGKYSMSGQSNVVGLDYGADLKDATTFDYTTHINLGGLKSAGFAVSGFWEGTPDGELFSNLGLNNVPCTFSPTTGADGQLAYMLNAISAEYSVGGAIGENAPFSIGGKGNTLVRGTVMHNATRTATSTGVIRQLGAVSATQKLHAAIHVITASGTNPTLDVVVQSDNLEAFGSPLSRITFAQKTAIGSEYSTLVGAITDDWYRVSYTIGGTGTPTFEFIVAIAIGI